MTSSANTAESHYTWRLPPSNCRGVNARLFQYLRDMPDETELDGRHSADVRRSAHRQFGLTVSALLVLLSFVVVLGTVRYLGAHAQAPVAVMLVHATR